jgi:hypothetical protein
VKTFLSQNLECKSFNHSKAGNQTSILDHQHSSLIIYQDKQYNVLALTADFQTLIKPHLNS